MNTELLVMAAGMGSRFGGLKQIAPIGPNGEIILDFSVYDAVKAGFNKVVIIIKKEIEKEFREACGKRIEKMVDVEYAFQELNKLPAGFEVPADRQKPWGTGHAVLCARDKITSPFAVINADDFYGYEAFKSAAEFLKSNTNEDNYALVGYKANNTFCNAKSVKRGVCGVEDNKLTSIVESSLSKNENDEIIATPIDGSGIEPFKIENEKTTTPSDSPLHRGRGEREKLLLCNNEAYPPPFQGGVRGGSI